MMKSKKAVGMGVIVSVAIAVVLLSILIVILIRAKNQADDLKYRACSGSTGIGLPMFGGVCKDACDTGEIGLGAGTLEEPKNGCPKENNPDTEIDESTLVECCIVKKS